MLKSGAGVVVVLLALSRPCTLASSESRIKTLFFLSGEEVLVASVEAPLGEGEESSVVDDEGGEEALVLRSVEVDAASGVVDEAGAFSLLLQDGFEGVIIFRFL